jgi:hypothetical protein
MNAKDYNGHVPDEDSGTPREPLASPSREAHERLAQPAGPCPYDRDELALRHAWTEGYLAAVGLVAARAQAQIDKLLERRPV